MRLLMNRKHLKLLLVFASLLSISICAKPFLDADEDYSYEDRDMDAPSGENIPISTRWLRYGFNPKGPMYPNDKFITYSLEADIGYRCDQYDWHMDAPISQGSTGKVVNSKITYANIGQLGLIAKVYFGNLFLAVNGDWGYIWDGKNDTDIAYPISTPPIAASFHSGVKGHVQDYSASLGYYCRIYAGKKTKIYLLPQAGYQWNFQHFDDHNIQPQAATTNPSAFPNPMIPIQNLKMTYSESNLKARWSGAFLGLSLFLQPHRWEVELGGTYAWLQEHFSNDFNIFLVGSVTPFVVSFDSDLQVNSTFHTQYAYTGFLKLKYHLSSHWLLGFTGSYLSAKVDSGNMTSNITTTINITSQPSQVDISNPLFPDSSNRWQSWSGFITVGYLF